MRKWTISILVLYVLGTVAGLVGAQSRGGGRRSQRGVQDLSVERNGGETWDVDKHFKSDVFTFVRIRYPSTGERGGGWRTDYPDSDLNFSFRLQQMTSLKVE